MDAAHFFDVASDMIRSGQPPEALARLFDEGYKAIAPTCVIGTATCAHAGFLVQCSKNVAAFLELETETPTLQQRMAFLPAGIQRLQVLRRRMRYEHRLRVPRRPYCDEQCGVYPFRDAAHDMLRVLAARDTSEPTRSGRCYDFANVEPFLRTGLSRPARAALYRSRLMARRLKGADLLSADERQLIGQRGVFATVAIPAGTCLGVYGGQLLRSLDWMLLPDDRYLIAGTDDGRISIDGESLLSLANTLYTLDANGEIACQPDGGYSCEMARFPARFAHGWEFSIPALFASQDIAPGEELRWHYGIGRIQATCAPPTGVA